MTFKGLFGSMAVAAALFVAGGVSLQAQADVPKQCVYGQCSDAAELKGNPTFSGEGRSSTSAEMSAMTRKGEMSADAFASAYSYICQTPYFWCEMVSPGQVWGGCVCFYDGWAYDGVIVPQ